MHSSNVSLQSESSVKRLAALVARDLLPVTFSHMAIVIKKDVDHLLKALKIKLILTHQEYSD